MADRAAPAASAAGGSLLASIGGVTLILVLCKFAGFGEKVVVAHYLGTSGEADGYYAAFAIVWALVFIVRELIQPACLPVYVEVLRADDGLSRQVATAVAAALTVGIAAAAGALWLWPQGAITLVAPGFEAGTRLRAAELLRDMSLGAGVLAMMGLSRTLLNAHRRYCWAAAGELLFRFLVVGGLLAGFHYRGRNIIGPALAGSAAGGLLLHAVVLRGHTGPRRPAWDQRLAAPLKQMLLLVAPLVVGVLCSHAGQLVDTVLASGLSPGRVSALHYGRKLTDAIALMGPVAAATVLFAHFSRLAAAGRLDRIRGELARAVRILIVVSVPVAILVVALRAPMVRLLFEHGRFTAESTRLTAIALAGYGPGIVAFSLDGLIVGTFYALKDMKTPVVLGVAGVAADIGLAWLLMHPLEHLGVAAAISLTRSAKVATLLLILFHRLDLKAGSELGGLAGSVLAAGAGMTGAMAAAGAGWDELIGAAGRGADLLRAGIQAGAGLAAFGGILWLRRVPELREAADRLLRRAPRAAEPRAG